MKSKLPKRSQKRRNFYGKANRDSLQPLGSAIENFLQVNRMQFKMDEVEVILAWKKVFGDVINKKTRHLKLYTDGSLVVTLNSGPLKEEFSLNKEKIVTMLNDHLRRELLSSVRIR